MQDSLPERLTNYSDSGAAWVAADHMTTPSVYPPSTLPVLYVDEYGFHNGIHLWRGYFTGSAMGVFLNVQGGTAFGWSAYLNGDFIGSFLGSTDLEAGNLTLSFSNATMNSTGENVLLVIQDNSGHDETTGALNPRGITNATLLGTTSNFTAWKVAGTAGGDANPIDPMRGHLNEGGLTAERLGWHLPGFDDSSWSTVSSIAFSAATANFYRTTFNLIIPSELDVSLAFQLTTPASAPSDAYRTLLFVNGYQYARFNPYIGNQITFPVPPGILNYDGENTVGVAIWAQTEAGAEVEVQLVTQYTVETGYAGGFDFEDSSYLRPGWTSKRLQYA